MRKGGEREKEKKSTGVALNPSSYPGDRGVVTSFTTVSMMPMAKYSTRSGV